MRDAFAPVQEVGIPEDEMPVQGKLSPIQRVKTPALPNIAWIPEKGGTWDYDEKLGTGNIETLKFYKNYLLTLKWQMVTNGQKGHKLMGYLDKMLGDIASTKPEEIQTMIQEVNKLTPKAKDVPAEKKEPLDSKEEPVFMKIMDDTKEGIEFTRQHKDAIPQTFGDASKQKAIDNYAEIASHLTGWQKDSKTRVSVNRAANAGYKAYNLGLDEKDKATLTLGATFFSGDPLDTQATLVHEASHGRLGTTDIAYRDASYFSKITGGMALKNADHYAHALVLAKTGNVGVQAGKTPSSDLVKVFQQGMSLCFYKLVKIWPILKWLTDKYQGQTRGIQPDTLETHESQMELGGKTSKLDVFKPIAAERTSMLREVTEYVRNYIQTPSTFHEHKDGTSITVKPINTSWPEVEFPTGPGTSAESLTKTIFVTLFEKDSTFSRAQSEALFNWSETLFNNAVQDDLHRKTYHISEEDMELYNILKG